MKFIDDKNRALWKRHYKSIRISDNRIMLFNQEQFDQLRPALINLGSYLQEIESIGRKLSEAATLYSKPQEVIKAVKQFEQKVDSALEFLPQISTLMLRLQQGGGKFLEALDYQIPHFGTDVATALKTIREEIAYRIGLILLIDSEIRSLVLDDERIVAFRDLMSGGHVDKPIPDVIRRMSEVIFEAAAHGSRMRQVSFEIMSMTWAVTKLVDLLKEGNVRYEEIPERFLQLVEEQDDLAEIRRRLDDTSHDVSMEDVFKKLGV